MAARFTDDTKETQRFSDYTLQPRRMLPPILGYENMPLVSLEKAVEPLHALVPEVERMTWTVKQNHFEDDHHLTADEAASILLYTLEWEPRHKSFYAILNTTLQAANRQLLKPWFLFLRLIITSLAKLPSESVNLVVYRGVKLDLSAQYSTSTIVTWWGFSSCTKSVNVLSNEEFLGQTGTRTLFNIECHSAKSIKKYSLFPEEEEVLLPPARQFQVIGCLNSGHGLHIVQLKEVQPKFPLINPVPVPSIAPSKFTPQFTPPDQTVSPPICKDPRLQQHIDALYSDPALTTLDLTRNKIGDLGAGDLAKTLLSNKTLITLDLQWNEIGAQGARDLANALFSNKTLTTINLEYNKIGAQGALDLANALLSNKTLTTLNLRSNGIGPQGALDLANALHSNSTLTTLYLEGNEIGAQGARDLAKALLSNKTLTILNLRYNRIGNQGAGDLADALLANKTLTTLDLEQNKIGDQGTRDLAKALQSNKTLTTLNLGSNQIGDQGAGDLAKALLSNKTLTTLGLQWNEIEDASKARIRKLLKTRTGLNIWLRLEF
ncbi:unnamed protein product [Adineta ricciae]|uniref:NAD(P)(+)--arginine ADP-ribosyltransferase n=1 Tax=Adineta ricciae TaxID=249248 RepID=A0A816DRY5_ADIRI|nr:unnamed protein product [Adineta ricciae]